MLAVGMARDEDDIIASTVEHLINQGCRVVLADNLSTDNTALYAAGAGAQVILDTAPEFRQGAKMTALAAKYAHSGEWVVPFDADEEWSGLADLTDDFDVATAHPMVQIPDGTGWRDGGLEKYPKTAFRYQPDCVIDEGNHFVFFAGPRVRDDVLSIRHFQYRTLEQVKRKVRQGTVALTAAGLPEWTGAHWRDLARLSDEQLACWWETYCRQ